MRDEGLMGIGYLAGPMTGYVEYNYRAFNNVARRLRRDGFVILNPAEQYGGNYGLERDYYFRADVGAMLVANYMIVLPGWEHSSGANLEVDIGIERGIDVYAFADSDHGDDCYTLSKLDLKTRPPRMVKE